MTYTKCPFCGKSIRYLGTDLFTCDACHIMLPAKHWLAYINTRKALEIAVDALKSIDWCGQDYANAQGALDEIVALEQKDE